MHPLSFLAFHIFLQISLSNSQGTGESTDRGFLPNGTDAVCDSSGLQLLLNESCPYPVRGLTGKAKCSTGVDFYTCTAAIACSLPLGTTDGSITNSTTCPSSRSLVTSLGIYNALGVAYHLVLGKPMAQTR